MKLPSFRDVEGQVGKLLREQGGIGALVLDFVSLGRVERGFGAGAYHAVHAHIDTLVAELKGSVRDGDMITFDERHPDRYVVFLDASAIPRCRSSSKTCAAWPSAWRARSGPGWGP